MNSKICARILFSAFDMAKIFFDVAVVVAIVPVVDIFRCAFVFTFLQEVFVPTLICMPLFFDRFIRYAAPVLINLSLYPVRSRCSLPFDRARVLSV